jgi:starch phosphorylase
VAVGLLYQEGYFQQYLNADGWQQESYPDNDFYNLPLTRQANAEGEPLTVDVEYLVASCAPRSGKLRWGAFRSTS